MSITSGRREDRRENFEKRLNMEFTFSDLLDALEENLGYQIKSDSDGRLVIKEPIKTVHKKEDHIVRENSIGSGTARNDVRQHAVDIINARYAGVPYRVIAQHYGCSVGLINHIVRESKGLARITTHSNAQHYTRRSKKNG